MRVLILLGCILALDLIQANAQCGGEFKADSGHIDIPPSNISCLWIIKLNEMTGIRLNLKRPTTNPIILVHEQSASNANFQSIRILPKIVYTFEGKILAVMAPPGNTRNLLSWTGVTKDKSSRSSISTEFSKNPIGAFDWQNKKGNGIQKVIWAIAPKASARLNWTLNSDLSQSGHDKNTCQCSSLEVFKITPEGNLTEILKTCAGHSTQSVSMEKNSQLLVLMQVNSTAVSESSLQVAWRPEIEHLQRNVEGIIAGTEGGVYVVPINNSSEPFNISSSNVHGIAFHWGSRKVYWAEGQVGILRANLDGSGKERLVEDRDVRGLAIDEISGNFYYGTWTTKSIRVCNNNADKCSTIASTGEGSGVYDIALHLSKGYLFWSIWGSQIMRAQLDGTAPSRIVSQQQAYGIGADEREDRLYWSFESPGRIKSSDLNGQNVRTLPNIQTKLADVEIDGDRIYYTNDNEPVSVQFTEKQSEASVAVANFPSKARYLAMFGTRVSERGTNPCENANCTHLCVLMSPTLYRCLLADEVRDGSGSEPLENFSPELEDESDE